MADIKFTGLSAASGIPDNDSVMAISTYDGVSTYTSEKYTMTQLKDIVYVMEAEDKITFDSSGTNKTFLSATGGSRIAFDTILSSDVEITTDNGTYAESWLYLGDGSVGGDGDGAGLGFAGNVILASADGGLSFKISSSKVVHANSTGLGFNNSTPIAKPTITGSRGGNAALASLLTNLASYGLITDSTSA